MASTWTYRGLETDYITPKKRIYAIYITYYHVFFNRWFMNDEQKFLFLEKESSIQDFCKARKISIDKVKVVMHGDMAFIFVTSEPLVVNDRISGMSKIEYLYLTLTQTLQTESEIVEKMNDILRSNAPELKGMFKFQETVPKILDQIELERKSLDTLEDAASRGFSDFVTEFNLVSKRIFSDFVIHEEPSRFLSDVSLFQQQGSVLLELGHSRGHTQGQKNVAAKAYGLWMGFSDQVSSEKSELTPPKKREEKRLSGETEEYEPGDSSFERMSLEEVEEETEAQSHIESPRVEAAGILMALSVDSQRVESGKMKFGKKPKAIDPSRVAAASSKGDK